MHLSIGNAHCHKTHAIAAVRHPALSVKLENGMPLVDDAVSCLLTVTLSGHADDLDDDIDPFIDPDATPEHLPESPPPSGLKTSCTQGSQCGDEACAYNARTAGLRHSSTGPDVQSLDRHVTHHNAPKAAWRSPGPSPLSHSHDYASMISDEEHFQYPSAGTDDTFSNISRSV